MINADKGCVYINMLPLSCAAAASKNFLIQHKVSFQLRRWSTRLHTNSVSVSRYSESTGFMLQPAQALPHRFLSSASGSGSCQFCQHCQRCIFVHTVSLNRLYLGTESPSCVRSTSPLPEPDPSPEGFHRWEVFLGVGSWLGKKAQTEISIWNCEVGSGSCEHSHRCPRCLNAPYDGAVNKSTGTNTSIHHSILPSPSHIITTLKTKCLTLFCVFLPIFTVWALVHDLISLLHSKLTSCLLWCAFIFLACLSLSLPM